MMVPRSYHVLHQAAPSSSPRKSSEKMGARSARTPSLPHKAQIQPPESKEEIMCNSVPNQVDTGAAPTQSKPVVIPPRTTLKTATSTQTVRVRGHHGGRPSLRHVPKNHKNDAIPPAVAALLAVTEIPRLPHRRRKGSTMDRRISMDELIQEWNNEDSHIPASMGGGSPLDLLLGRVDESEDEYGSLQSLAHERSSVMSRSTSDESITTIPPSLDMDSPSFASNWDSMSTTESYGRSERREKTVQSLQKEECLDHPLLQFEHEDIEDIINLNMSDLGTSRPVSTGRFRSFKSNLTASFQAMKSAAKSFSNFTAPSVPPDDLLTRSLLSPMYVSEMRPKQLQGLPSPALRRYLNPQATSISPAELSMQLHDALMLEADSDPQAPMIQMQTYDRRARSNSRKRKTGDPFSEAGRALAPSPTVRQREPRENSDFLRVIVLEMNMRRVGKLDAKAVGKARIWLPPRRAGSSSPPPSLRSPSAVPERWISTPADGD